MILDRTSDRLGEHLLRPGLVKPLPDHLINLLLNELISLQPDVLLKYRAVKHRVLEVQVQTITYRVLLPVVALHVD